ncbi:GlxA family transcriptional regulator [Kineococcus sp. SYSU DK005]|uniref:GlxA family transcriptional regulator n=1 Tax=Kineococcus sp. SYSU DK005 TaxID=3383126 RepID=UPI003D7E7D9B
MRPSKFPATSRGRAKHVIALVVLPDTVTLELAVAQQVFGRRVPSLAALTGDVENPYELVLVGEGDQHVLPSGVDPGPLAPLETVLSADTVMVPGVEEPLAGRSRRLCSAVAAAHRAGARMVSFCSGAFVLGAAGVLDGRTATTHWLLAREFRAAFPRARLAAERLWVDDGPVHTSGGIFSATDLALHLLALDLGHAYANDLSRVLISAPHRPGGQSQFVEHRLRTDERGPGGADVQALLSWIRENIAEPHTLASLARREHLSERHLARRFRAATGVSVFDWITAERVRQAKVLLEGTDFPVAQVAAAVGLGSSESLRRNFTRTVGTTPAAYRATFRTRPAVLPAPPPARTPAPSPA